MNSLSTFTEPLGWALLHFLWQGAAIALLLRAFLWLARRSAPQVRYAAAGAALLLMAVAVAGTVWWLAARTGTDRTKETEATAMTAGHGSATASLSSFASLPSLQPKVIEPSDNALPPMVAAPVPSASPAPAAAAPPAPPPVERFRALIPWLVGAWAAGVALFSLRLVNGWRSVRRWRLSAQETIPAEWSARFTSLCDKLRISRPVRLLSSASLAVPVVIGWLKPVVLVPAGLFSGIPAAQLEAILAHELAHIRRCDWLVNLLQTVVETLLFYHPAVWWVSAQLRKEREHCCDDIAASLHGDTLGYARALTALEELRAVPSAVLSAAGGSLLQRIRRLAGLPEERAGGVAWPLGILTAAALALALVLALPRQVVAQQKDAAVPAAGETGVPDTNTGGKSPVEVARSTGQHDLADGIKLRVTSSEDGKGTSRINTATIEWYAGNGELGLQWPIELTAGLAIDPIVWKRGGAALWIVRNGVVRKIDFANAADVKETVFKKGAITDYGGAPAEVALEILRIVTEEMARFETELKISVPAAESKGDRAKDELVINVKPDGSIVFKEKALTLDELAPQLTEIAKANSKQAIIIRGSADTRYDKIVEVLDATHKAGLYHVSFATTQPPAADEKKAAAEKLLEQGATAAGRRDFDAARKHFRDVAATLGKSGDDGVRDEYLLLLADAEVLLGRIDGKEADGIKDTETAGARQKAAELRESAIKHYTDAAHRLLEFDRADAKSVPCRVRLASVYLEMAGVLKSNGAGHDARVACTEAAKVYVELLKEEPECADHCLNLAKAYELAAELTRVLSLGQEGIRQALEMHQQGVGLLRRLLEKVPKSFQVARQLSASLSWRMDLHRALGDAEAADSVLKEAASLMESFSDAEKIRGARETFESEFRPPGQAPVQEPRPARAPEAKPDSSSIPQENEKDQPLKMILQGKDGSRREVVRDEARNEITDTSFQGDEIVTRGVFYTDKKGRLRRAAFFDGRSRPLGTVLYGHDRATGEPVEEQHFNKTGKLIRRVFYPGALKDPKYAGRYVAFIYDSDNPKAQPVEDTEPVMPARPATGWNEGGTLAFRLRTLTIPGKVEGRTAEQQLALAKELRAKLTGGADFATLAKEYSRDSRQESGGDWGVVFKHSLAAEFWQVVSKLPEGELSDVMPLAGNFYIFRVENTDPESARGSEAAVDPFAARSNRAKANGIILEKMLEQAQSQFDAGNYDTARKSAEQALELNPANKPARDLLERVRAREEDAKKRGASAGTAESAEKPARVPGISLSVQDTTGKTTLKEFRVIAGVRAGSAGGKDTINWQPHTLREGKDGALLWPLDKAYDEMALRVEAEGYMPQVFNWIDKKKGPQDLVFQMLEIKGLPAQVLMPDGKPAEGATVALAMVQRDAVLEGGKLRHADEAPAAKAGDQWRRPRIVKTNATGQCMLPAENDPTAALLIVHESGVREISLRDFLAGKDGFFWASLVVHQVKLQPWARVAGKVQWGDKPGAGQKVSLTIHRDSYGYPGIIAQYEKTTAAADGSFVFEKVLPGHVQLSCPISAGAGNTAGITEINLTGRITHMEVKPGDNTVVIGGGGTAIKGRLTGRDSWEGVTFHFHPTAPHIGLPGDDEIWKAWGEFQKSPEGALYFRSGLKVNAGGTFEVGGVMPGDYQIFFKREGEDKYLASGKFAMKPETVQQEPMDIGEFKAGP